jgi:hypothetical protein
MNGIAESKVHLGDEQHPANRSATVAPALCRLVRIVIKGSRKHGRSGDTSEGYSPVDVPSEG